MTVGIVGAGQLGRMLALAGYPLGLDFLFLDPAPMRRPAQVAPLLNGAFTDRGFSSALAERCEVVTFDWENVPVESLRALTRAHGARICPPVAALAAAQDRVGEKRLFEQLEIPTTRWQAVRLARAARRARSRRSAFPGSSRPARSATTARARRWCARQPMPSAPGSSWARRR